MSDSDAVMLDFPQLLYGILPPVLGHGGSTTTVAYLPISSNGFTGGSYSVSGLVMPMMGSGSACCSVTHFTQAFLSRRPSPSTSGMWWYD